MMTKPNNRVQDRIKVLADLFAKKTRFVLMTHVNPDGDAVGSCLALGLGLASLNKKVTMFCQGGVPYLYGFLPGTGQISSSPGAPEDYDIAVLLDCHDLERAGDQALAMSRVPVLAVVDHHIADDASLPEHSLVDPGASSAGELVYHILTALGAEITPEIATNIFVAISTDTGSFSYENTSSGALSVCAELVKSGAEPWGVFQRLHLNKSHERLELLGLALRGMTFHHQGRVGAVTITSEMLSVTGAASADTEGVVEYPRSVKGVELAVLFRQTENGGCKVSLRSRGRVNVAALSQSFGGGGHHNAAGFYIKGAIEEVKKRVINAAGPLLPLKEDGGGR